MNLDVVVFANVGLGGLAGDTIFPASNFISLFIKSFFFSFLDFLALSAILTLNSVLHFCEKYQTQMFFLLYSHPIRPLKVVCFFFNPTGQAAADAKYYGNTEVYNILKARGAKSPVQFSPDFNYYLYICPYWFNKLIFVMLLENQEDTNGSCKSSRSSRVWA